MTKLEKKPFALIGVNRADYDAKKLKEVMIAEKMNWRSTSDKDGEIAKKWNDPATPCYYLIDAQGVIRYKWVGFPGDHALDAGLEKLIAEAEGK